MGSLSSLARIVGVGAHAALGVVLGFGCGESFVAGTGGETAGVGGQAAASSSTAGTGGSGATGGGGAFSCTPGEMTACYEGPAGTEGVAMCQAGTGVCNAAGDDVDTLNERCRNGV